MVEKRLEVNFVTILIYDLVSCYFCSFLISNFVYHYIERTFVQCHQKGVEVKRSDRDVRPVHHIQIAESDKTLHLITSTIRKLLELRMKPHLRL